MIIHCHGMSYHVQVSGNGPPLLLLHGFTGSVGTWDSFVQDWQAQYQVIAVDLLGHGKTKEVHSDTQHGDRYDMMLAVRDLVYILDELGIKQTAVLGYSMGGRLALSLAILHPERVNALVLEGASPGLATKEERAQRFKQDEQLAVAIEQHGMTWFVDYWESLPLFARLKRLPLDVQSALREQRMANRPAALARSLRGMGTGAQPSWWEKLKQLHMPVLLLAGEYDHKFCQIAEQMALAIEKCTYICVQDAGHVIHLEQPREFDKLVREFLTKIYK